MIASESKSPDAAPSSELMRLFHRLNNQLGVILANAELLENRIADDTHRARASQVVTGVLEAITTTQQIRQITESATTRQ